MMPRGRRSQRYRLTHAATVAREALERRWFSRLILRPDLAEHVTAQGARQEPFHRWFRFRQGFSPALVRLFLDETEPFRLRQKSLPVLDPFSGSGTTVIECARRGAAAIGVEASAALAFITEARFAREWPPIPDVRDVANCVQAAPRLVAPIHRAVLMFAEAGRYTTEGKLSKTAPTIRDALERTIAMISADLEHPLATVNTVVCSDARDLSCLGSEAVCGILTSPPYLSRYDYDRLARPLDVVYSHWADVRDGDEVRVADRRSRQIRAARRPRRRPARAEDFPAPVQESSQVLVQAGHSDLANLAEAYFADLRLVLRECRRVLPTGAPFWLVIGGARLKDVYVPSDLIAAELAEACGFHVEAIWAARRLIETGRKLGTLRNISPRESVVVLTAV